MQYCVIQVSLPPFGFFLSMRLNGADIPGVMNLAARASSITVTRIMREHCIDCFFGNEEDSRGLCFLYPDNPVEVNYSDPACENFELSE